MKALVAENVIMIIFDKFLLEQGIKQFPVKFFGIYRLFPTNVKYYPCHIR